MAVPALPSSAVAAHIKALACREHEGDCGPLRCSARCRSPSVLHAQRTGALTLAHGTSPSEWAGRAELLVLGTQHPPNPHLSHGLTTH